MTPSMIDSDTVFRYRIWIFTLIFWGGFALYGVDHVNSSVALVHLVRPSLDVDSPQGRLDLRWLFAAAAACAVLAAAIRTWAAAYLRTSVVHDTRMHGSVLVASGPYRYVRNPLYLGGILLALGFAMLASRAGAVTMVVGVVVLSLMLIHGEEQLMQRTQAASFAAYRRLVPRLVPALAPRVPATGARAVWGQAVAGELFFWIFAIGAIGFAVTLDSAWIKWGAIVGLVVHLIGLGVLRARAS
jgi:protein-S-isoprenylcysteine O-methyltransferase Ste14